MLHNLLIASGCLLGVGAYALYFGVLLEFIQDWLQWRGSGGFALFLVLTLIPPVMLIVALSS